MKIYLYCSKNPICMAVDLKLLYITCKDKEEADRISKHLISLKLAACTNSFQMKSTYPWQGKVESGKEVVLIAKTKESLVEEATKEVETMHSYDVPCILKISLDDVNPAYRDWLEKCLR